MDNKIIDFEYAKRVAEAKRMSNGRYDISRVPRNASVDKFEKETITPPKLYSFEDMIDLVGYEKVEEIFKTFLKSDDWTSVAEVASPPTGETPLKEGLETIWSKSEEVIEKNNRKRNQLLKMRRAIKLFENECSKRHEKKYGEKIDMRIKITTEEEEIYLAQELRRQADFYRKNKISATAYIIKQKLSYLLGDFIDSLKI